MEAKEDPGADTGQEPGGNLKSFSLENITAALEYHKKTKLEKPKTPKKITKPDCTLPETRLTGENHGYSDGGSDND